MIQFNDFDFCKTKTFPGIEFTTINEAYEMIIAHYPLSSLPFLLQNQFKIAIFLLLLCACYFVFLGLVSLLTVWFGLFFLYCFVHCFFAWFLLLCSIFFNFSFISIKKTISLNINWKSNTGLHNIQTVEKGCVVLCDFTINTVFFFYCDCCCIQRKKPSRLLANWL